MINSAGYSSREMRAQGMAHHGCFYQGSVSRQGTGQHHSKITPLPTQGKVIFVLRTFRVVYSYVDDTFLRACLFLDSCRDAHLKLIVMHSMHHMTASLLQHARHCIRMQVLLHNNYGYTCCTPGSCSHQYLLVCSTMVLKSTLNKKARI